MKTLRRALLFGLGGLLLVQGVASAHERFIRHVLKNPLKAEFFLRQPGSPLGMDPNLLQMGILVTLGLTAFLTVWFMRETIDHFVRYRILSNLRGRVQRLVHYVAAFVTDKPVRLGWFYAIGEWAVIMFLRSPALVLMYSATNDSLVMPSYPLEPHSAELFKFLQALLAILILTQTLLPLCGALVLGTWFYLFSWGPLVAVDALPVVTVAVVYMTSPWRSHKLAITRLNPMQTRWVRIVLGFGFLVLGWTKVYNYNLTAAVADNYPHVMNDPMVGAFAMFTDPALHRETWVVAFGLAEVLSGFMLMTGIFTRVWAMMMLWVFTKLMVVDFGWDEIPHMYPIGALVAVIASNFHGTEFDVVERTERRMRGRAPLLKRLVLVGAASAVISFLAVMPLLYGLTFTDRSYMGYSPVRPSAEARPPEPAPSITEVLR